MWDAQQYFFFFNNYGKDVSKGFCKDFRKVNILDFRKVKILVSGTLIVNQIETLPVSSTL